MIGSIHDCIVTLKSGRGSRVLLREGAQQYRLVNPSSVAGIEAFDPLLYDAERTIGLFTPSVPASVVYDAAGEPLPGRLAQEVMA